MRTLLATPCVHFYDDHLAVDLVHAKGSGQKADVELCSIAGKVLDTEKHSDTQPTSIFTGARFVWTMSSPWGVWLLQPSPADLHKCQTSWLTCTARGSVPQPRQLRC